MHANDRLLIRIIKKDNKPYMESSYAIINDEEIYSFKPRISSFEFDNPFMDYSLKGRNVKK